MRYLRLVWSFLSVAHVHHCLCGEAFLCATRYCDPFRMCEACEAQRADYWADEYEARQRARGAA